VNLFDLAAVALIVVAVILGHRSGALPQVAGLVGAIGGGAVALLGLPMVEELLQRLEPATQAVAVVAYLLLALGLGEAIGSGIGQYGAYRLRRGPFAPIDRVGGAIVGVGQAVLIIWLAGGLLAAGPLRSLAQQAQTSTTVRALSTFLPAPTEIAVELGRLLDATGLPQVFIGLEPIPAPPVERPDDPVARSIAAIAEPSTVKVTAETCGLVSTGTGFAASDDYVVSNAHVVAGSGVIRVSLGAGLHDAVPVLFDPDLDVVLLWVPGLDAPPLRFAREEPERGTVGAALGFPGGGRLTIIPAAVAGAYDARGLDIYSESTVTRPILELRAAVDRGDSGGPFVLADGTVGGVIFAEARSDDEVGYALSGVAVAARIAPGFGRQGAVDVGPCMIG
jgi:S1-C subfamily serine protease